MASTFLGANLPSEDEEDADFVPSDVDSDEERAKRRAQPKKVKLFRGAGAAGEAAADGDDAGDDNEEAAAMPAHKKARVDELWQQLNAKPAAPPKPAAGVGSLAALSRPVAAGAGAAGGGSAADALLRQMGLAPKRPAAAGAASAEDRKAAAAAAMAAAKAAASAATSQQYGMVSVTETRRFAGQTITVTREVEVGSRDAKKAAAGAAAAAAAAEAAPPPQQAARNKAGLDAVLSSLERAKKVTVLDKTTADWRALKKDDEALATELDAHRRSGGTYLDKQAFLKQTELAEYEKDRDRRLGADVRNRGRL